jgi:hypothetical protein
MIETPLQMLNRANEQKMLEDQLRRDVADRKAEIEREMASEKEREYAEGYRGLVDFVAKDELGIPTE